LVLLHLCFGLVVTCLDVFDLCLFTYGGFLCIVFFVETLLLGVYGLYVRWGVAFYVEFVLIWEFGILLNFVCLCLRVLFMLFILFGLLVCDLITLCWLLLFCLFAC